MNKADKAIKRLEKKFENLIGEAQEIYKDLIIELADEYELNVYNISNLYIIQRPSTDIYNDEVDCEELEKLIFSFRDLTGADLHDFIYENGNWKA